MIPHRSRLQSIIQSKSPDVRVSPCSLWHNGVLYGLCMISNPFLTDSLYSGDVSHFSGHLILQHQRREGAEPGPLIICIKSTKSIYSTTLNYSTLTGDAIVATGQQTAADHQHNPV